MKKFAWLAFAATVSLSSCIKVGGKDDCPTPDPVDITTNSPVQEGWSLSLDAPELGYLYKWTGPNNYKMEYSYYSNTAHSQFKENMTAADAGIYKLQLVDPNDNCVIYEGTTEVKVVAPAPAPCTIANNTVTATAGGVAGGTYSVYVFGNTIAGSNFAYTIEFNFRIPPKPGLYKTSGTPDKDNEVSLVLNSSPNRFGSMPGQDVYVIKVGGKLQVSFCSHRLNNPVGSFAISASGKLTQP